MFTGSPLLNTSSNLADVESCQSAGSALYATNEDIPPSGLAESALSSSESELSDSSDDLSKNMSQSSEDLVPQSVVEG